MRLHEFSQMMSMLSNGLGKKQGIEPATGHCMNEMMDSH